MSSSKNLKKVHPITSISSNVAEILEKKSANIMKPTDDIISEVSSSIHSAVNEERRKKEENNQTSKKSSSSKLASTRQQQQQQQQHDRIMKEVIDKIIPDTGEYDEDGYQAPEKQIEESKFKKFMINLLMTVGCLTLDLNDAILSGSVYQVKKSVQKIMDEKNPRPELINQYNREGFTPLSLATKINSLEIIGLLLENNAGPDYVDENSGRTPIYYSILNNNPRVTKMLIGCLANVNVVDFQCITPLMIAVSRNDLLQSRMLITANAEIDMQDDQGWTALHHAANCDAAECIVLLLHEGADRKMRDLNKRRAIHVAKYKGFGNCIAALGTKSSLA